MIRQLKELKNIQALITKASYNTVIKNINSVDIDENTIFAEIYYNASRNELFTNIAFQIYSLLKNNIEICVNQIAELIIDETKTNNLFALKAEKGYINIQLSDSLINSELNRINKENFCSEHIDFDDYIELFPIWYCINKVNTALRYLWDSHIEKDPTKDNQSRSLSLNLIYIDYKEKVTMAELLKYSEQFYEFDRTIIGTQIPYSLYKAIQLTFTKIIWKNKLEKW